MHTTFHHSGTEDLFENHVYYWRRSEKKQRENEGSNTRSGIHKRKPPIEHETMSVNSDY